jgi:hypothetical protein
MNFIINVIWKHLVAAVLQNWTSTVSGVIESILIGGPSLAVYFHGKGIEEVQWMGQAGFIYALWRLVSKALAARFSWSSILGAMLKSAPKAQIVEMTTVNTTKK